MAPNRPIKSPRWHHGSVKTGNLGTRLWIRGSVFRFLIGDRGPAVKAWLARHFGEFPESASVVGHKYAIFGRIESKPLRIHYVDAVGGCRQLVTHEGRGELARGRPLVAVVGSFGTGKEKSEQRRFRRPTGAGNAEMASDGRGQYRVRQISKFNC